MTTERNKRIILSLRMESNHAPPAFRADVLTTVLERSVDHSFRSVLCSKGNTSNITRGEKGDGEITHARLFFLPLPCFIPLPPLTLTPSPFKISPYLHLNS